MAGTRKLSEFVISNVTKRYRCQLAALAASIAASSRWSQRCAGPARCAARRSSSPPTTASSSASTGCPNNKGLPYEEGIRVPLLRQPAAVA